MLFWVMKTYFSVQAWRNQKAALDCVLLCCSSKPQFQKMSRYHRINSLLDTKRGCTSLRMYDIDTRSSKDSVTETTSLLMLENNMKWQIGGNSYEMLEKVYGKLFYFLMKSLFWARTQWISDIVTRVRNMGKSQDIR